jgi:hypothetical protein
VHLSTPPRWYPPPHDVLSLSLLTNALQMPRVSADNKKKILANIKKEANNRITLDWFVNNGSIIPYDLPTVNGEPDTEYLRNLEFNEEWKFYDLGKGRFHVVGEFTILWCLIPDDTLYPNPTSEEVHPLYNDATFQKRDYFAVCSERGTGNLSVYRFRDDILFNSLTAAINSGYGSDFLEKERFERIVSDLSHRKIDGRTDGTNVRPWRMMSLSFDRTHLSVQDGTRRNPYKYVKFLSGMSLERFRSCDMDMVKRPHETYRVERRIMEENELMCEYFSTFFSRVERILF